MMNGKIIDSEGGIVRKQLWNTVQKPSVVFFAGLAGGLAEVLWVGAVAAVLGVDASQVAREVAASVLPAAIATAPLGLVVHFSLSLVLAAMFSVVIGRVWSQVGPGVQLVAAMATLAGVWAVNFLVVLPWLNPVFTTLLPIGVTFVSKLLFALALWAVLSMSISTPRRPAREDATRTMAAS